VETLEINQTRNSQVFAVNQNNDDRQSFRDNFDWLPFAFCHRLNDDSRLAMDRIRALALRLPRKLSFSGEVGVAKGWAHGSRFEEALNKLEAGRSWIILKKVHEDPEYGSILSQCLSEVEELCHRRLEPVIESRTMSLILSSPGQVTPYHIDGDCNFLFQIRGAKAFYVFNGRDRSILTEMEEENYWSGDSNAAKYRDENQPKAWLFELKPGIGVHVPVIFPHWVKNGESISISLSVNFRFLGHQRGDIYRANHYLRKIGLIPAPLGKYKRLDFIKGRTLYGARMVARKLRRLKDRLR
jgi:hypothetical protein